MTPLIPMTSELTWVIDPTSPADLVRRMQWGQMMNQVLGLFPQRFDLTNVYRVLEIGCGAGEWTLEAVRYFPVAYVGIDVSPSHIAYAQAMAKTVGYDDLVCFEQANLTEPLPYADASFDLVHLRFLAGSLPIAQWPTLLHEAWRVLTPNGCVLLCEAEWPTSSSLAAQQFARLVTQALCKAGHGFSTDGLTQGMSNALPTLLLRKGWRDREQASHHLNFSAGLPLHEAMLNHQWVTAQLMQPFLTRMGYGNQHDLHILCEQVAEEGHHANFVGTMTVMQTWAKKEKSMSHLSPRSSNHPSKESGQLSHCPGSLHLGE